MSQTNRFPPARPSRRFRRLGLVALGLVAGVSACGRASSTSKAATEDVAIPSSIPAGVTLRVADQLSNIKNLLSYSGQNQDFPYIVQYSQFVGGPPMLQAFQAGAVDVGFVADTPIIFAQAAHQNVVAVAGWATSSSGIALVSAPGVHLTGWASLKGRKVAYQQGTVEEAVLLEGLKSVGLSIKDVSSVNLATTSITAALESDSVAAGILVQPLTAAYLSRYPTAEQVLVASDITARADMLIADGAALANPGKVAAIADFVGRLKKAYQWINTHQAQYAQDVYVHQYKVPLAEGEELIRATGQYSFFQLPGPLAGPQQTLADLYYQAGEIPAKVDTADEFSATFNPVVRGSGA